MHWLTLVRLLLLDDFEPLEVLEERDAVLLATLLVSLKRSPSGLSSSSSSSNPVNTVFF